MQPAKLTVVRPAPIVRATVPLEPPIPWTPERCPLVIFAADGRELLTQWEPVAFAQGDVPTEAQLVRVAEVLALDTDPPHAGPATYTVQLDPRPPRERIAVPLAWARLLAAETPGLETCGLSLVIDGQRHPFTVGARYRSGPVALTIALRAPHAFAWLTVFHEQDVAWLDLVIENAQPGAGTWYFDELALAAIVPPLHLSSVWPEPDVRAGIGGTLQLVAARADGRLHALEPRGWRVFQGCLHDSLPASDVLAGDLAAGSGWGVVDTWTSVDAYLPHALRIPDLAYRAPELRNACRAQWAAIASALSSGAPFGMGTTQGGRLDWRHPWGHQYGGVTGGGYRHQWPALEVLATGEPAGLLELRARLRMIADRSPIAIVQPNGKPAHLELFMDPFGIPRGGWRMSSADATFHKDGALGWSKASSALPAGREVCTEHAAVLAYSPIDFQHADRATKPAEALVYLANDPIARWWVGMAAELWRFSQSTDNRLHAAVQKARSLPAGGATVGRADGHGWELAAAAFALSRTPHRKRWAIWLEHFAELLTTAQLPGGLFQVLPLANKNNVAPPFGDGKRANYLAAKGTEEALLAGALFAVARCGALVPPLSVAALEAVDRWSIGGVWYWLANGAHAAPTGFTDYVAVRPVSWDNGVPTIGEPLGDPAAAVRKGKDSAELLSPVGCAMLARRLAGRPLAGEHQLVLRLACAGAPDPLAWMRAQTFYKLQLDDCAPAHAALQFNP